LGQCPKLHFGTFILFKDIEEFISVPEYGKYDDKRCCDDDPAGDVPVVGKSHKVPFVA
jgi:hypothetical protein